jgi:hypothetical protein
VANFLFLPPLSKYISLVISSSGTITYSPTTQNQYLFKVSKLYSLLTQNNSIKNNRDYLLPQFNIPQTFFIICQLPKFRPINNLELKPLSTAKYIKSPGSKGLITKISYDNNLALIKLPSGVRKAFSVYSTGLLGPVPCINSNLKNESNAGFRTRFGRKPLSRGVAKNPVDHPHGGRNKAIRYQRTP